MEKVLLIDGENFKGKIKTVFRDAGKTRPEWHEYDFRGLLNKVLGGVVFNEQVFYFARIKEHASSPTKSQQLIEEQRLLLAHLRNQDFNTILAGSVRGFVDYKNNLVFKEKGVDVRMAVDMVSMACDKQVKEIVLGSSDSDLQPAIKETRNRNVECVYLGFEANPNKGLTYTTNKTILIRDSEVFEFEKIQKTLV